MIDYKSIEEAEIESERQEYVMQMRQALSEGKYHRAFENAGKLTKLGYFLYRTEIDSCCKECADNGVVDALIFQADKYTVKENGRFKAEAVLYLEILADIGYVKSFSRLADCYYYGLGTIKNIAKAIECYGNSLSYYLIREQKGDSYSAEGYKRTKEKMLKALEEME